MFNRDFSFIDKYFIAEKQESLLFLILGIVAIGLAVVFFFFIKTHPAFFRGAAIPLVLIGLIQCVVGFTVYARTDEQRKEVAYKMGLEPVSFVHNTELPRMKTVMRNFVVYRYVEIALALTGIALFFIFRSRPEPSFWMGLGLTLAIQSLLMLGADYFAESRGKDYTKELENRLK